MPRQILLIVFSFLTILCFTNGTFYTETVNDQQSESTPEVPSIPYAEVLTQLLNFVGESVEDCSLPCFAGIRPGETTLSEIKEMSADLFDGDTRFDKPFKRQDDLLAYTLRFNQPGVSGSFSLSFIVSPEEEVLRRFDATLNHPHNWLNSSNLNISEVLATLGVPDEVYILIAASQPSFFFIVLGYRDLGTVLLYAYQFGHEQLTQSDEPIPLCGSWANTSHMYVWIQAVDEKFYEDLLEEKLRLKASESTEGIVYRAFWPLKRMTNWNIEDLTQFLAENPEWCFDALSYRALLKSGYSY